MLVARACAVGVRLRVPARVFIFFISQVSGAGQVKAESIFHRFLRERTSRAIFCW